MSLNRTNCMDYENSLLPIILYRVCACTYKLFARHDFDSPVCWLWFGRSRRHHGGPGLITCADSETEKGHCQQLPWGGNRMFGLQTLSLLWGGVAATAMQGKPGYFSWNSLRKVLVFTLNLGWTEPDWTENWWEIGYFTLSGSGFFLSGNSIAFLCCSASSHPLVFLSNRKCRFVIS